MRAFQLFAAGALLLAGALSVSPATGNAPLDGWGPFRFGMTPDQAHAVPGFSWQHSINTPVLSMMNALPMTTEYGPDTNVSLAFNSDKKLWRITLAFKDIEPAPDCEKSFLDTLGRLDRKYGAFAPGGDKDTDWFIQDSLVRGGLLEQTSDRSLPGSRSRYWHRAILPNISGLNVEAEARHAAGLGAVEAITYQRDGDAKDWKNGCHLSILFADDTPTKAQREMQFKLAHVPTGMDWHWAEVDKRARGFSSGPVDARYSTGAVEHLRLTGGRFAADLVPAPGGTPDKTLHLTGTIADHKISARAANAGDDLSFNGGLQTFMVPGEPVDTYEIFLTGNGPHGQVSIAMAAYHRNSPHKPSPTACASTAQSVRGLQRNARYVTYSGLLKALGCPTP
ncbi:MAG TPA: hypothetical protein VMU31_00010 [Rhizomicrobium sp.]|nr:hypothetical protein [Rhizomicrobium sp.]